MITNLNRYSGLSATRQDASRSARTTGNSFRTMVGAAVKSSSGRNGTVINGSGRGPEPAPTTVTNTSPARQSSALTATPAALTAPAAPANPIPPPPTGPGAPSAFTLSVMAQLSTALQAAGIDPKSLNMVAHDDVATYPGASYVNRLITLQAGNRVENFMADLTAINPNVAVQEIKRLISMG